MRQIRFACTERLFRTQMRSCPQLRKKFADSKNIQVRSYGGFVFACDGVLIGAAAGYWIIVSRSDVPTSGICSYDSTNLLRYYLADESSDQFGKALNGDLGSASATYDGEFHFPIVSKTPNKKIRRI